jgi:fibronectin type 3 domain-containing protein
VPLAIYPTNNAESIEFSSVNLQWSSTDALTYDVYFGTDSPPVTLVADNTTSTSYGLVPLAPDTSYYWRIEASNLNGSATNTFTFRTAPLGPTPGVVAQPANRRRRAL